jgi:HEAT repeat protein
LDAAFAALKTYGEGSGRAALLPLDEAARAAAKDTSARSALERRLAAVLQEHGSVAAREYVCAKLTLIGSASCVPTVAALLSHPTLSTAARNTLEAIPGRRAVQALRAILPKLDGLQKVGVIHSLGRRRDTGSTQMLAKLLKPGEPAATEAAVAALGEIGTSAAAKALRDYLAKSPPALHAKLADALLCCAERLSADGKNSDAAELYRALKATAPPRHVQHAVAVGLERTSGRP